MPSQLVNVPNLLSASRVPLAAAVCACVSYEYWYPAAGVFAAAAVTDWLDGWWARRYGPLTAVGRALDPLTDKVLICGAFVYLLRVPGAGVEPWMVAAVVGREMIVTGVRGMVEATGAKFGADKFGKLKTVLQFAAIFAVLLAKAAGETTAFPGWVVLAAVLATLGSGVQYLVKAARILGRPATS